MAEPVGYDFYFENPQPINDSELSKFPNRFRGVYMNSDSTYIRIKENIVLTENYYSFRVHKNVMDSLKHEFSFSNGKFISKFDNRAYIPKKLGDSVVFFTKYIDTFFVFSNRQKAKLLHGQLVLSSKDSVFWKIKTIQLEKNKLIIKHLYSKEDLKRMDSITNIKSIMLDSSSYVLKPSRSEFVKFIKLKHFGYEQEYIKVDK